LSRLIKILVAEDNQDDLELLLVALTLAGYQVEHTLVFDEEGFRRELGRRFDIVFSDYKMPQFTGLLALEIMKERAPHTPFIIVSGTIGEETAVQAMRLGATDYLLKDRLGRLGLAVERALSDAALRRERESAVAELRLFRHLIDQSSDTIEVIDPETSRFIDVNDRGPAQLGYTRDEYLSMGVKEVDPGFEALAWIKMVEEIRRTGTARGETIHRRKDGSEFPIEFSAKLVRLDRDYIVSVLRDITERRSIEKRMREQLDELLRWQRVMLEREDRVLSLKAEVNAELARRGEPARYEETVQP